MLDDLAGGLGGQSRSVGKADVIVIEVNVRADRSVMADLRRVALGHCGHLFPEARGHGVEPSQNYL
jgi:hypothetical protein